MSPKKYVAVCLLALFFAGSAMARENYFMWCDFNKLYQDVPELKASKMLEMDFINEQDKILNDAIKKYKKENQYFEKREKYSKALEDYNGFVIQELTKKEITPKEKERKESLKVLISGYANDLNQQDQYVEELKAKEKAIVDEKKATINAMNFPRISKAIQTIGLKNKADIKEKEANLLYVFPENDATLLVIEEIKRIITEEVNNKK